MLFIVHSPICQSSCQDFKHPNNQSLNKIHKLYTCPYLDNNCSGPDKITDLADHNLPVKTHLRIISNNTIEEKWLQRRNAAAAGPTLAHISTKADAISDGKRTIFARVKTLLLTGKTSESIQHRPVVFHYVSSIIPCSFLSSNTVYHSGFGLD